LRKTPFVQDDWTNNQHKLDLNGKESGFTAIKIRRFLKGPNERMPQGFVQMTRSGTSQGLATWITTAELCVMIYSFKQN